MLEKQTSFMMKNPSRVRKAVIPAAGFGTRLFPATQVVKKELFPVVDRSGIVKPVIVSLVEEALSGGIEEVAIVIQPGDRDLFSSLFHTPPKPELWQKLKPEQQVYSRSLQEIGKQVTFLPQTQQDGYGHAVFCAKEWVNGEPFVLLLGDRVFSSDEEASCTQQAIEIYHQTQRSTIGLNIIPGTETYHSGCVVGTWEDEAQRLLHVTHISEKPTLEYARQHLQVEGLAPDEFLSIFGIYVLTADIFEYLREAIDRNHREAGEFQLTTRLELLQQELGAIGYRVNGQAFDVGLPQTYRQTVTEFGQSIFS